MVNKMQHLEALVEAVERARQDFVVNPTYATAATYQKMKKQHEAFRRTLPKPRIAA